MADGERAVSERRIMRLVDMPPDWLEETCEPFHHATDESSDYARLVAEIMRPDRVDSADYGWSGGVRIGRFAAYVQQDFDNAPPKRVRLDKLAELAAILRARNKSA